MIKFRLSFWKYSPSYCEISVEFLEAIVFIEFNNFIFYSCKLLSDISGQINEFSLKKTWVFEKYA